MVGWSIVLFAAARSYYLEFGYQKFDLGNMVQAVWSTTQGRPLEATFDTGEQAVRLAGHVDPILILLAPVWMLAPTPLALATVQIAACALGALPVFWLGRRHLGSENAAGLLALTYLAYPWLVWTALDAIHPVTLAIPLFLYCIWFLDGHRLAPFAVCAILVLATGELIGLTLAGLGLWYWLARGRRRAGVTIALAGAVWTTACIKIVVPAFRGSENQFYRYFDALGGSPEGVLRTAVTDPGAILDVLLTRGDLLYLVALTAPLAGAFLLAPGVAAIAVPQLTANGLTSFQATVDPRGHYIAAVIPFLIAATVFGLARLPAARRVPTAVALLAVCTGSSLMLGPWPGIPGVHRGWLHSWEYGTPAPVHIDALHDAVALVPDDASVATTNKLGSRLSARRHIFSVPLVENADWIVIDSMDPWVPLKPRKPTRWGRSDPTLLEALTIRTKRSREWTKMFERDGVLVFRRVGATDGHG
jgi:uncharacterized membrane protein